MVRKNFTYERYVHRENVGQFMKSKQLSFIEKFICLAILSVNSVYRFSECIYLIAYILLQINGSYFSKIALVRFQYEPVSLDVTEVCFEEKQDIPDIHVKNQRKVKALQNVVDVGNET